MSFSLLLSFSHTSHAAPTFKVDGCGVGAALAGRGLDRVGGVVARARCPGYGTPLGDNGRLTEGNDGVLVFQAPVVIQRMQPSLPDAAAAAADAAASACVTVQLLKHGRCQKESPHASIHTLYLSLDVCPRLLWEGSHRVL